MLASHIYYVTVWQDTHLYLMKMYYVLHGFHNTQWAVGIFIMQLCSSGVNMLVYVCTIQVIKFMPIICEIRPVA